MVSRSRNRGVRPRVVVDPCYLWRESATTAVYTDYPGDTLVRVQKKEIRHNVEHDLIFIDH